MANGKKKGVLLFFHGPDKSGKGTQSKLFAYAMYKLGFSVAYHAFPDYSTVGGLLVNQSLYDRIHPPKFAMASFYALDRTYHIPSIMKDLEDGKIVVCKRSSWDNLFYQTTVEGSHFEHMKALDAQFPAPYVALMLDIPITADSDRYEKGGFKKDRYERAGQEPIINMMRKLHTEPVMPANHIEIVNGRGTREDVFRRVLKKVIPHLAQRDLENFGDKATLTVNGREEPYTEEELAEKFSLDMFQHMATQPEKHEVKKFADFQKEIDFPIKDVVCDMRKEFEDSLKIDVKNVCDI